MRAISLVLAGALVACAGPSDETLMKELRVLSLKTDPPQWSGFTPPTMTSFTIDPTNDGGEVLIWSCLPQESGTCAEDLLGDISAFTNIGNVADETLSMTLPTLPAEIPFGPNIFGLACLTDLCPLIEDVRKNPAPGTEEYDAVIRDLSDPFTAIANLPIEGTALSFRTLLVDDGSGAQHPTVRRIDSWGDDLQVNDQIPVRLYIEADSPATVYPFTTAGGFQMPSYDLVGNQVEMVYFAPEEPDVATIWIAVETEKGGSTLWETEFQIGATSAD